jgi:hypothetical protein
LPPQPTPASRETIAIGGNGMVWLGVLVGILATIVLILFVSWLRFGPEMRGRAWVHEVAWNDGGGPQQPTQRYDYSNSNEKKDIDGGRGGDGADASNAAAASNAAVRDKTAGTGSDAGPANATAQDTVKTVVTPAAGGGPAAGAGPAAPGVAVTTQIYLTSPPQGRHEYAYRDRQSRVRRETGVRVERIESHHDAWRRDDDYQPEHSWAPPDSCGCDGGSAYYDGAVHYRGERDDDDHGYLR